MNSHGNSPRTSTDRIRTVRVPLGDRSYPIYIGSGLLANAGRYFRKHGIGRSVVILTDENVAPRYLRPLTASLVENGFQVRSIVLPPGEKEKSLRTADRIYTQLLRWNIERHATIVALGGGVIGDLAGYIAATYQRGVGFVQIPTTLLAQVDSSVGGKVGINHRLAKNMIGAFYQPAFVLADIATLASLPKRELICGMGEVVKYGVILDRAMFALVEKRLEQALSGVPSLLAELVRKSCAWKAYVVSKDEKESGLRAILNFGHTIGHALEHAGGYGTLKHGEAVLYGMIAESAIALSHGMITAQDAERLEALVQRIPIPSLDAVPQSPSKLLSAMRKDKKVKDGAIRMTLPRRIGEVTLPVPVAEKDIRRALDYVKVYGA